MGRQLEPEVMESLEEAKAYDELDRLFGEILFQGFAESALRMGVAEGRVLDVGTGPGWIPIRLALLNQKFSIEAIDLSQNMLDVAGRNAKAFGVDSRIRFSLGDAKAIPFEPHTFDLVPCHNMLHQLSEPSIVLREIHRVAKPEGAILVRDVRRLHRPFMDLALPFYCLRYSKTLRALTHNSFRAGLTRREFQHLVRATGIERARFRTYFLTHHGLERPALRRPSSRTTTRLGSLPIRIAKSLYLSSVLDEDRP